MRLENLLRLTLMKTLLNMTIQTLKEMNITEDVIFQRNQDVCVLTVTVSQSEKEYQKIITKKALKKCKEELGIDDETKEIRNGDENNMKKKDLETENKYLKLQLDIIYDLLKNSYKYDEKQLYETIGVILHCSNKETYDENMKFIKENELPYDFFER